MQSRARPPRSTIAALAATLLIGAGVGVEPVAAAPKRGPAVPDPRIDPKIDHEKYRLDNGLEVILHQDNSVPLVAVNIWYHVGSGNETPGKSGFAHLFEHMLFQGAQHVGEDVHFDILRDVGATSVNGSTNKDRTNYFEVVPSHELETALWLESDRMGYLLPTLNQQSLENQIEVVRNERRQSYDNRAYGATRFALAEALYPEGHPYRYMTIGRHEDLEAAKLEDVRDFYSKWYVPANATLVLAGDFEMANAKRLVQKWFGSFPLTERPQAQAPEPPKLQQTTRRELTDAFARLRRIQYVWPSPGFYAPGDAELDVLGDALGAYGTGRLYKLLVHERKLAQSVSAYQGSSTFSGEFGIAVTLRSGADLAEVEGLVQKEIARVIAEPISEEELARYIVSREVGLAWGLESLLARAESLQRYNHYIGTPDFITGDLDRYRKTTPARIHEVAASVLNGPRIEMLTMPAPQRKP